MPMMDSWPKWLDWVARAFLWGLLTVLVAFGLSGLGCGVLLGDVPLRWVAWSAAVRWFLSLACS